MDRYSLTGPRPREIRIFLFHTNRARMNECGCTSFTGFVWTEGQFVLNCEIYGFKNIRIRVEGALVNVLRKVSKTKCCYIAEVHCQTIVSRVRGKKKTNKKNIKTKIKY